jgi:hypothetical protein
MRREHAHITIRDEVERYVKTLPRWLELEAEVTRLRRDYGACFEGAYRVAYYRSLETEG